MCKLPGTRKGLGGCRHAARGWGEGFYKAETRTKLPSRCRGARERPASEPGGGSGLGKGSRKLSGYWGVSPPPTIAVLTSSRKPKCGSLSVSTSSPQLPGSLQPPAAAGDPAFVPAQASSSPPPISSQAKQPGDWAHAFPSLSSRLLPIRCCDGPGLRHDPGLMGLVVLEVGGAVGRA